MYVEFMKTQHNRREISDETELCDIEEGESTM